MQSVMKIVLSIFFLTSVAASAYYSSAKLRRDGVLNLYPFPRVGRASKQTWEAPVKDFYFDLEPMKKQLYAFPRVGRSSLTRSEMMQYNPLKIEEFLLGREHENVKRESEADSGMWFGPRLGRGIRSDDEDVARPDQMNQRGVPERTELETTERKKRQTN